jgi:hypothetical protein
MGCPCSVSFVSFLPIRPKNGTHRESRSSVPFDPFDPDSHVSSRAAGLTPGKAPTYTEVWGTELQDTAT